MRPKDPESWILHFSDSYTFTKLRLSSPTLGQAGTPRSNKSTPGELPGPPRGTSRKMSKRYGKVLPGMPPGSRGQLFHIFSMKNEARPSAAPPQGGGGFAAAPLWGAFFIEKLWKSTPQEAPGLPGSTFPSLFHLFRRGPPGGPRKSRGVLLLFLGLSACARRSQH